MNIPSTSYSSSVAPDSLIDPVHPLKDFKTLQGALKAGDMDGAQQALNALTSDFAGQPQMNLNTSSSVDGTKITDDVNALQSAISSKDTTAAHEAFKTLRHDLRTMRQSMVQDKNSGIGTMPPIADGGDPAVQDSGSILDTQA